MLYVGSHHGIIVFFPYDQNKAHDKGLKSLRDKDEEVRIPLSKMCT